MSNKYNLQSEIKNQRVFTYSKNGVTLNFTLNTDDNSQLKAFKELLDTASEDVADLLTQMEDK